jgi:hypothetical protein
MRRFAASLAVMLVAVLGLAPARAADTASARAFVAWIYSHYPTAKRTPEFDPFGRNMGRIFHPSLAYLINEDSRLAHGEVGALDGDPFCDCQDDTDLVFKITSVRSVDPTHARAVIVRGYPDRKDPESGTVTLDLTMTKTGWRVFDTETKDTPSLRAYLIKSNRVAAHLK